ncbi:CopCD domain protein [Natrialba magadii ATCC 43099]|uniref:CopCD domain protein n=1 Tax=Natrialba magadii (strain ATCC 43099 / DSM 3394 / CCM 3739 / CIP 104546 / IAM 13178 / JCM 8861 / NBRC 102185 / NCIMB 2190 / MS3) TaxID=547559 RepID=D3SQP2_NATMM|nr:copper resistance protein CopC [Natrialba magadii]ADD04530.1 CopCD domain protein [Natrialba magadii ATCC 43099]ELY25187.1 copper resistance protein CopC [Natrialba magadii ATCC 43099]
MRARSSFTERDVPPRRSLLAAILACLVVAALAVGLVATPAAAHAYLSESDPANGEQVDDVPEEVTLFFSGDGVVNADITVEGPDGEVVSAEPEIDPDDTQVVRVPIEDADTEGGADADGDDGDADGADGMYTVDWEVLADDGHTTSGSFFFAVGDEPLDRDAVLEGYEDDETDESVPPVEAGAKALLLVGVVGLIGIPAITTLAVGPVFARAERREAIDRRLTRLLVGAAALTLVGAFALGLARSTALGPLSVETITQFTETPLGQAWLVQSVLSLALVGLAVAMTRRRPPRRTSLVGTFIGALAVAGTIAWTSHSATAIDRFQGAVVDFVHLVGAGLWVGGLVVLAFVVVPHVRAADTDDRSALLARTIRRYSVLALVGVTLVVTTGLALASWHVPTADGLTDTFYGLTLLAKLVLIAAALALGGITRFVLLGRLESAHETGTTGDVRPASTDGGVDRDDDFTTGSRIAHAVRLEVALLIVVVLLSGVLTSAPTAAVAGVDDEVTEATIEYEYDDVLVEVTALPVVDATNESFTLEVDEPIVFEVTFLDDEEPVESDQSVRLLASSEEGTEMEVGLEAHDDGTYATVQPLPDEGHWDLRVTGAPDGSYVSEWIDATAVAAGSHDEHEHDHDDEHNGHDHDHDDHADHAHDEPADQAHDDHDSSPDTAFATLLQFGAVAIAVVGSVAVVIEATRFRE